jgi:myo-inositol-1(or 4)-monophosphatase
MVELLHHHKGTEKMDADIPRRLQAAQDICRDAGKLASDYFRKLETLTIEHKGHQDLVSEADKNVEVSIRGFLTDHFPDDGIVGEEYEETSGRSGYTWVIDPIDGTANFLSAIPAWTIVLACVYKGKTMLGVIYDPNQDEMYTATAGDGAFCNNRPMKVSAAAGLSQGTVGVGYSNRINEMNICKVVSQLIEAGSMFYRNASGALSLAYVADGRLLGYVEEHMNAWDCIAGQLLVSEAGGMVEHQNADDMIKNGGRVVVGAPTVFGGLCKISDRSFDPVSGN